MQSETDPARGTVRIRPAQSSDWPAWRMLDAHLPQAEFGNKVALQRAYVLVDADDAVLGLLRYNLFWDLFPFCTLLYVAADQRGKGYGKRLMAHWEADMRGRGHRVVLLSTQSNEDARHFYRHLGYEPFGEMQFDIEDTAPYAELFLKKTL